MASTILTAKELRIEPIKDPTTTDTSTSDSEFTMTVACEFPPGLPANPRPNDAIAYSRIIGHVRGVTLGRVLRVLPSGDLVVKSPYEFPHVLPRDSYTWEIAGRYKKTWRGKWTYVS